MSHCPQCGSAVVPAASKCDSCGLVLSALKVHVPSAASRTLLGGVDISMLPTGVGAKGPAIGAKTIMGMPARAVADAVSEARQSGDPNAGAPMTPAPQATRPSPSSRTMMGIAPPSGAGIQVQEAAVSPSQVFVQSSPSSRTLQGVAMPGIAPLNPGVEKEPPPNYQPASELGATLQPRDYRAAQPRAANHQLARRLRGKIRNEPNARPQVHDKPKSGKAWIVVAAGAVLAIGAVLFAFLYKAAAPLTAKAAVDDEGAEVLLVRCDNCPDGTNIRVGGGEATVKDGEASVPIQSTLSVGENQLRVKVDRPGSGRDETILLEVGIDYRIRPDVGTLQGDTPSLQVVVEAIQGTKVKLDGRDIPLVKGRATQAIDVSEEVTGAAAEAKTLKRSIPYEVTPPDGEPEKGTVEIGVGILPLVIRAPGPSVVIDQSNFVLAGRSAPGATVAVSGRAIETKADGTFAQVMNVSSVGSTEIQVRTSMPEKAPRLFAIAVRRVNHLSEAAKDFEAAPHRTYAQIKGDIEGARGKSVILRGQVSEVRKENHQTIILLSVPPEHGCDAQGTALCQVRLVHGIVSEAKRDDMLTVYGTVAGPFEVTGRSAIPEIDVAFFQNAVAK